MRLPSILTASFLILAIALSGCAKRYERVSLQLSDVNPASGKYPNLRAHLKDGRVCIFREWSVDQAREMISGQGRLLDINRALIDEGGFEFSLDSIALFQADRLVTSPLVGVMAVITVASAIVTVACLMDPKACFGSCPTFYVSDGERPRLQAEGFSASVAPVLEASDTDALFRAKPDAREFEVVMRNEALETHVVRHVDILAAPRPPGGRVFVTPGGEFWQTGGVVEPTRCVGPEGDCLPLLNEFDGIERTSETDSTNLAKKEIIELQFDAVPDGELGLVVASRQSLLSTFLFYQALAYMGNAAAEWIAALEAQGDNARQTASGIGRVLGGIEVLVGDESGDWHPAGEIRETGPLATHVHVVPLSKTGPVNIRLRLNRGAWRVDYIALTHLIKNVEPMRLQPSAVLRGDVPDASALGLLRNEDKTLMTLPGDEYTLVYDLPENYKELDLFLDSRGYYIEWMREEWLREEDPALAAMMLFEPEEALRVLAPEFKRREARMEKIFWSSRYARQ